ncbi:MAG: hypothetical protein Hyperionvirus3_137 [Hyperionvirus sp.]|uniref:Phosphoesterase HXTX domain-containing protein n=1 Tax=Hyperionvirus sp. TaxID=2487770 RepID=A0A3G5A9W8_9VIRU|nr:MAG: hypothetical protein Hyperionvirus3_137 [Hyperionvirus sp.]
MATKTLKKLYNCAVTVPCVTHQGKKINPAHMTIAFLGGIDENSLEDFIEELKTVARPLRIRLGKTVYMGRQKKEARECEIIDAGDRKIIEEFSAKWTNGETTDGKQMYHITKDHIGKELDTMTEVVCTTWYVRALGRDPNIITIDTSSINKPSGN